MVEERKDKRIESDAEVDRKNEDKRITRGPQSLKETDGPTKPKRKIERPLLTWREKTNSRRERTPNLLLNQNLNSNAK